MLTLLAGIVFLAGALSDGDAGQLQKALVHHTVSTQSSQAQTFFDEGLTLVYAFNREEAQKRFRAAAAADPKLALAWWGVALAAGPNLNIEMTPNDWKTVREGESKAQALSADASPEERRLIDALAKRYPATADKTNDAAYRDAMNAVHVDYPADDDAATLYVESAMDADEWGYRPDGTPLGDTAALVAVLNGVVERSPFHPGANHYLTHLKDFQSSAKSALPNADRLSALAVEPAASHLKHMSGHIYLDLGMYASIQRDNRAAVEDDRLYASANGRKPESLDYYFHNLDFYTGGSLMLDDVPEASRGIAAFEEAANPNALIALDRLGRFKEALATFPVPKMHASLSWIVRWHYARGIADVSLGRIDSAQNELATFAKPPPGAGPRDRFFIGAYGALLAARIAYARGEPGSAIGGLRSLNAEIAGIPPEAFPAWYFPVGEWLGWMLLDSGDAEGAEAAFRADLARTPHNARALYGLMQSLSRQDRTAAGDQYATEIARNWRGHYAELHDPL